MPTRRAATVPPPESAHLALIVLADLFTEVVEMPFDQAVSRLTGVRDLMAASPGLARYRAALTGIIEGEAVLLQLRAELDAV